jgi:hypothetical protein
LLERDRVRNLDSGHWVCGCIVCEAAIMEESGCLSVIAETRVGSEACSLVELAADAFHTGVLEVQDTNSISHS